MGTDIHVKIQARAKNSDEWNYITLYRKNLGTGEMESIDCYTGRDYELFDLLSSVGRSHVDCLVEPRGLPEKLAPEIHEQFYCFDEDGEDCSPYWHSTTWYDITELRAFCDSSKIDQHSVYEDIGAEFTPLAERFRRFVYDINQTLDAYWIWYPNPGEVQVIMWFDS